ncbi:23S rRNA (uracil(1939)-C(5))-methyltransferase RlmD [Desulfolucanica intricata]|uniref:23S rRNA (uracil(1939)-C(5))-methyltransferase RlmD n=1 Tax=Desulfolucanica intricata TaxID=1285191 RepID=UPI000831818D|nr:23S rRNA (uracil(1939)-C(5))-methyltransferase RlmD [Desulfolucanica intricata]
MSGRLAPVKVNDIIAIEINDINHQGEGVGRYHDFAVFVPSTSPGEKISARITEVKKSFARGRLVEILDKSVDRCEPNCQEHIQCGGCHLQHINYSLQLELKRKLVQDNIKRIGGLKDVPVLPTIGMDIPWHYRNKVQLQVGSRDKKIILGFYAVGSHELVKDSGQCGIVNERLNEIILILEELLKKYHVRPFNWENKTGLLRHVILRIAIKSGQVMLILVTVSKEWPEQKIFCNELRHRCPDIVSIIRIINKGNNRLATGQKTILLSGKETITDYIDGLAFDISALSFYQINPIQTLKLYDKAREYARLSGSETVIDAYCGIGTVALYLSRYAARVIGLEQVSGAVKDAKNNAATNNINNTEFQCGTVEKLLPAMAKEQLFPEVIILDPPRQGCKPSVLDAIAKMKVSRVVYISCNPSTLARDMRILSDHGYNVIEVQPVDMFPQTAHVECVTLMSKVEK